MTTRVRGSQGAVESVSGASPVSRSACRSGRTRAAIFARTARIVSAALLATVSLAGLTGCSSDPPTIADGTFCGAAKAARDTCNEPLECDEILANACDSLRAIVSDSALVAARDCLESGICAAASCLGRAQKSAKPTAAHEQLAADFCATCAPHLTDCASEFYARGSKLPGVALLPYAEAVVSAVDAECTGATGCQATFTACANDVVARVAGERLDPAVADCIGAALTKDESSTGPGGGVQVITCTPDNCAGCCRDDACEEGTSTRACGNGAAACQTCSATASCDDGKCKEPCGPDNCAGCCEDDTCVDGTVDESCGERGAACDSCTGSFVCSNHTCIDTSCQATCTEGCCSTTGCEPGTSAAACGSGGEACVDCGSGRTCTAGSCVLDRTSLWDVYVSFAVVPDKDKKGAAWDLLNGAPDPYVMLFSSEGSSTHSGVTSTIDDSAVPFWAETPMTSIKASELLSNLSFEIWDSDTDADDYIGGCRLPLTPSVFDGSLQSYACPPTASGVGVTLYYRINPRP